VTALFPLPKLGAETVGALVAASAVAPAKMEIASKQSNASKKF
jgi:hypothetical protein